MENIKLEELPKLIDLLAEQTTAYMKMVSKGATKEEFETCQRKMKTIQQEIESRKGKDNSTSSNDTKQSA